MKKTDWQYLVDTLLFLCIVGIIFIGFLMGLVLPKGPQAPESAKYFLGLHRHQWGNVHFYLSIVFTTLVIIHLILSWKWIKSKSRQIFKKGWSSMLILTALASILILALFWAFYPRIPGAYEDYGVRAGAKAKQHNLAKEGFPVHEETIFLEDGTVAIVITGQTTLRQVEEATGIPAKDIAAKLGLPEKVSPDESFGRLRKLYPIAIQNVRDAVTEILNKRTAQDEKKEGDMEPQVKSEEEQEPESKLIRGTLAEDQSGILITGRMTFYDIQKETDISARKIADKLGLPESTPLNETLGRLRKRYTFSMQDVRDAVADLMKKK
jgi:predicted RecB family endonuclease